MKEKWKFKNTWPLCLIIGILAIIVIKRINYVLMASENVPVMDYWRYIYQFGDKIFQEGVTLKDLWVPQAGATHRPMGVPIFLFLMNVKYFGLNTQIEIVGGVIALAVNTLFLLWVFLKKMKWEHGLEKCGFILLMLCVFNINQWEIMTLEFSMGFAIRALLLLISLYLFDHLQKEQVKWYQPLLVAVWMFIVACLSGSYGPAVVGAMCFVAFVQLFVNKTHKLKNAIRNFVMIFGFCIGTIFFMTGIGGGVSSGAGGKLADMIADGRFLKAIFYMLGSSVLHVESSYVKENIEILTTVGIGLFILYLLAIFLFFKRRLFEKTYLPIMLMAYAACSILAIAFGRIPMYGVKGVIASRYVCETTLGLVGLVWILWYEICYQFKNRKEKEAVKTVFAYAKVFVCVAAVIGILRFLDISANTEYAIAPYRGKYQEGLINKMKSDRELTDSELAGFQSERKFIEEAIEIMKRYGLGVFGE